MADRERCPNCGSDRPARAPQGLCPRCLLQRALDGDSLGLSHVGGPAANLERPLRARGASDLAPIAALGLAVASVGAATYWPLLSAVTTRAADRPGLAVGGVSAAGYLGFLAGPPIVGAIAEGAGLRVGVLALALAGAVAASIPLSAVARRLAAAAAPIA